MKVDKYCYLDVYLQNQLPWTSHVDYSLHKGNCLLGFLTRNLKNSPRYFKEYAYQHTVATGVTHQPSTEDVATCTLLLAKLDQHKKLYV